jgi:hypothetical protein
MNCATSRAATVLTALALLVSAATPGAALAPDARTGESGPAVERPALLADAPSEPMARYMARDEALVLESNEGYNSGYIFGMTKGIANSTVHPAVKPVIFLVTIPLDLVLLPFAAIGGLF